MKQPRNGGMAEKFHPRDIWKLHLEISLMFGLIQMNQNQQETFLLAAMILLLADPSFMNLLISILRKRRFVYLYGNLAITIVAMWQISSAGTIV